MSENELKLVNRYMYNLVFGLKNNNLKKKDSKSVQGDEREITSV